MEEMTFPWSDSKIREAKTSLPPISWPRSDSEIHTSIVYFVSLFIMYSESPVVITLRVC